MNAVRHYFESTTDERLEAGEVPGRLVQVKDLMTKYFYRDEHLCFQLLVLADGGEKVLFQEFTDYAACKRAWEELQQLKAKGAAVRVPEKKKFLELVT